MKESSDFKGIVKKVKLEIKKSSFVPISVEAREKRTETGERCTMVGLLQHAWGMIKVGEE